MTKKSQKQIINEAADLLETKGWVSGSYAQKNGYSINSMMDLETFGAPDCYCALGAIAAVQGFAPFDPRGFQAATPMLAHIPEAMVSTWNDTNGQTAENVIKTMREVAEQ